MHNFITPVSTINIYKKINILSHMCKFNINFYSDSLYTKYDVDFPQKIKTSSIVRKAEYLAGRYCSKYCLSVLGFHNFNLHSNVDRTPAWPANIKGSISHTRTLAVAAISYEPSMFIGVDIEPIMNKQTSDSLANRILFYEEPLLLNKGLY